MLVEKRHTVMLQTLFWVDWNYNLAHLQAESVKKKCVFGKEFKAIGVNELKYILSFFQVILFFSSFFLFIFIYLRFY